jgi:hypothetical protein
VVIAVDGLVKAKRPSLATRLLTSRGGRAGVSSEALDEVLRALGKERIDVVVLDRPSGRRLGGGHRARLARGPRVGAKPSAEAKPSEAA